MSSRQVAAIVVIVAGLAIQGIDPGRFLADGVVFRAGDGTVGVRCGEEAVFGVVGVGSGEAG